MNNNIGDGLKLRKDQIKVLNSYFKNKNTSGECILCGRIFSNPPGLFENICPSCRTQKL